MTVIHLTDDRAAPALPRHMLAEPHRGSVVLTHGEHGTAWQRHFHDGLWHRTGGGRPRTWTWLLTQRQVVVVYDAPERKD